MVTRIRQRLYSLPLRTHLLLMAFLLALPAVVLIAHSGMSQHQGALRRGFSEARRFVNLIGTEQYNLTGNVEELLTTLEQLPEVERHDSAATSAILSGIIRKNSQFANIIIADRHGAVWASALPMTEPFSVAQRRSFQQAVLTRRFSSGDFGVGRISHKPTIGFGYPILDQRGVLLGVILANINFQHVNELFHIASLPAGSSFSIIDRNGVIVARNLDPVRYVGSRLRNDFFLKMQRGPEQDTFIAADVSGEKKIISYRKMTLRGEQEPYLFVRAAFPKEKVLEDARLALIVNISILSLVLAAAVLSVIFLGNIFFVKRIESLQQAALRLAEGDLEARVSDAQGGEIGHLAEVFDDMAAKLAARQATLIKSEHDLHELNVNLTRRVEEETERRLHHERLLARHARLVAMGQMIGAIAHQWRQPLATLGVTVQSIRLAWEHNCLDEAFLKKAEEDSRKQLLYMSDTIEDFRNFFTPDKVAEGFAIRDKIDEVIMLVSPQFAHSGVKLKTVDLSHGAPLQLVGYQNEFTQSLLNLVSNAFDAIMEKGLDDGGEVTIVTAVDGDRIRVEVRDNGCGISAEHADKVFDPYFTTKPADKGTGIGLYMTRLIIEESMGGSLSFTSTPEGTTFRIELSQQHSPGEVAHGR
jgi:C4-dicarboxylate-specific signal transduction histidine kinase